MVLFTLTMPSNNSWNGKWSREGTSFCKSRPLSKEAVSRVFGDKEVINCYYNFGDGWGANVEARVMTAQEAKKSVRKSKGFCGYDWMIDEIVKHGRILGREERNGES